MVSCEKEPVTYQSITGYWRCEEYNPVSGQTSIYTVDIERSKNDSTLYLLCNFQNVDINECLNAYHIDSTLVISGSTLSGLIVKSGIGLISDNNNLIKFSYEIFDGQNDIQIKAVYTRSY
jgi:hypothetical protein